MKRFMIAVIATGVLFNTGLTFAQDEDAPQIPEKVRRFLDNFAGTWTYDGNYKGSVTRIWDAGKGSLIATGQEQFGDVSANWSELVYWDGISEDDIVFSVVFTTSKGIACTNIHGKVLSPTLMEGKITGVNFGKKVNGNIQIKFKGKDQYISRHTNTVVDVKSQPDETLVYTRVKPTTREDFEEFCSLAEGRWVSELTLRTDWPGMGKKGETITGYMQHTRSENGNAMTGNINVGKGWWTEQKIYDPASKQIKTTQALSNGDIAYGIECKIPGGWSGPFYDIRTDGTKGNTYIVTTTFSEDGKKWYVKVTTPGDEENVVATHVWHRMNK